MSERGTPPQNSFGFPPELSQRPMHLTEAFERYAASLRLESRILNGQALIDFVKKAANLMRSYTTSHSK